jgi:hypothetical protein
LNLENTQPLLDWEEVPLLFIYSSPFESWLNSSINIFTYTLNFKDQC